jgi:3-oxoacyl-[acyl-carrier protein] reductase
MAGMELQLADKVVLITGASGGIGRALAEAFAAEGARLALLGFRQLDALRGWLDRRPWREQALALRADLTRPDEVRRAFADAAARLGRLDACVANAGRWPDEDRSLDEIPAERMRATLDDNLFSAIWTAAAFFAELRARGPRPDGHEASLVFIGSTAGRFGERGRVDYSIAKAGMLGLVRTLKHEIVALDPFGRVNMVEPGWTATPMARAALAQDGAIERVVRTMPLRQIARPEDIARAVVFLCSPAAARHVSGETLTVAGGMEGRVRWEAEEVDPTAVRRRLDEA